MRTHSKVSLSLFSLDQDWHLTDPDLVCINHMWFLIRNTDHGQLLLLNGNGQEHHAFRNIFDFHLKVLSSHVIFT